LSKGIRFFTGVPDSLLRDFCAFAIDQAEDNHVLAANEGGAVALASGHYLATSQPALVYMQNSGQGNATNPLTSLADPAIYSIPMLLLIGWRGEPGTKDEPQHVKQGEITLELLNVLGIPYRVLPSIEAPAKECIYEVIGWTEKNATPSALVVRKGTFVSHKMRSVNASGIGVARERAIHLVAQALDPSDVVVSTTGKISRELYEYRDYSGSEHCTDFLTVGSMGHASQIAMGVAMAKPKRQVYCFDGDGSVIMHMGSLAILGRSRVTNFKHVIFNNGAHDSVGGQPTVGFDISFTEIALACGYKSALVANSENDIVKKVDALHAAEGPALLEVRVDKGARPDLGRPRTSPQENKIAFMKYLS